MGSVNKAQLKSLLNENGVKNVTIVDDYIFSVDGTTQQYVKAYFPLPLETICRISTEDELKNENCEKCKKYVYEKYERCTLYGKWKKYGTEVNYMFPK
jgi:hypothetical protein